MNFGQQSRRDFYRHARSGDYAIYESNREKYTFKPFTECFFHSHSLLYMTNFLQADVACRSLGHRGASAAFLGGLYGERASPVQRVVPLTISKEKSSSNICFIFQSGRAWARPVPVLRQRVLPRGVQAGGGGGTEAVRPGQGRRRHMPP